MLHRRLVVYTEVRFAPNQNMMSAHCPLRYSHSAFYPLKMPVLPDIVSLDRE